MQIHRVRGNDLQDALRRARRVHGERALVVSHEALPDGGVALAVARSPETKQGKPLGFTDEPQVAPLEFPREGEPAPEQHVGLREVAAHLSEHGASVALIERILDRVDRSKLDTHHAIDVAAEAIGDLFQVARSPRVAGQTRIMSAIGPPGGGKTTTLIKIAYRLLQANRQIVFATLDTHRVGAIEKLQAWANRFDVPLHAVRRPEQVTELLTEDPPEMLLLDTTGNPSVDIERLEALSREPLTRHMQNYLIMPATDSRSALSIQAASFRGMKVAGAVVTKVDETREASTTLEHILDEEVPVAFISDGQDVRKNLHRASADAFADLLLRGRLS
jgi:flagellar biosynthesis protein FlhF